MKVRIQRKRRPALWGQTKQLFALGSLCTNILNVIATYGGNKQKEAYEIVRAQNRQADTQLKLERQSYVVAQNQRLDLLNAKTLLELEAKYGAGRVREILTGIPDQDKFKAANYDE